MAGKALYCLQDPAKPKGHLIACKSSDVAACKRNRDETSLEGLGVACDPEVTVQFGSEQHLSGHKSSPNPRAMHDVSWSWF